MSNTPSLADLEKLAASQLVVLQARLIREKEDAKRHKEEIQNQLIEANRAKFFERLYQKLDNHNTDDQVCITFGREMDSNTYSMLKSQPALMQRIRLLVECSTENCANTIEGMGVMPTFRYCKECAAKQDRF